MQGTNSIGNVQNGQIQNTASKAKSKAGKTSGIQQLFGDILGKANSGMINNGSAKEQFSDTKADNTYSDIRFKDNSVPAARKSDINDKISDVVSQVDAKADNIKDIIKEQLNISDEEIESVMEQLGFTFMDLLDPQNLADFVSEIKGSLDLTDMIVDPDFQQLMLSMSSVKQEIAQVCDIDSEQMDEIISVMEPVTEPDNGSSDENFGIDISEIAENVSQSEEAASKTTVVSEQVQTELAEKSVSEKIQDTDIQTDEMSAADDDIVTVVTDKTTDGSEAGQYADGNSDSADGNTEEKAEEPDFAADQRKADILSEKVSDNNAGKATFTVDNGIRNVQTPETPFSAVSQTSGKVDILDIIQQVTEQLKVSMTSDETSMEMQLNPENLGKIYVNVSQKNSQITAHMMVMNEVVREALESQLGNLRETLSQAGVKVDAVEVTVASHEFEQNLEQNSSKEEKQQEQSGSFKSTRKNINMSSLDEMSGIMTEEENLVAQIMHDNGNSVDFMA